MRNKFEEQLEQLNVELIKTGALCEDAISTAAKALLENDLKLAKQVKPIELEIDQKEREIEGLCMRLLLQQQPVAGDLRQISSALKMISDLERIGDQAADIAELTRFVRLPDGPGRQRIEEMSKAVIRMVTDSVDSFVKRDLDLAREVCREDDQVDELFNQVKKELISLIAADAASGELWLDMIMVAKYLERIGDHATNVAEWVEYSITSSSAPSGGASNSHAMGPASFRCQPRRVKGPAGGLHSQFHRRLHGLRGHLRHREGNRLHLPVRRQEPGPLRCGSTGLQQGVHALVAQPAGQLLQPGGGQVQQGLPRQHRPGGQPGVTQPLPLRSPAVLLRPPVLGLFPLALPRLALLLHRPLLPRPPGAAPPPPPPPAGPGPGLRQSRAP